MARQASGGRSYQQFDSIRQLRVGYSGVYKISAQGLEEGTSYGQGQNHSIFTCCPTEMVWFRGWEDVSLMQMNVALSGNDVRECLKETLIMVCQEPDHAQVRKHLLYFGAYVVITYVGSLRGEESFCMDLGTEHKKYTLEGKWPASFPSSPILLRT